MPSARSEKQPRGHGWVGSLYARFSLGSRSLAGTRFSPAFRSPAGFLAFCADYHQADASYERDRAQDGRDGDGFGLFVLDLQRPHADVFLFVGEAEASGDEADDAEDDEKNSNQRCCFQMRASFSGMFARVADAAEQPRLAAAPSVE